MSGLFGGKPPTPRSRIPGMSTGAPAGTVVPSAPRGTAAWATPARRKFASMAGLSGNAGIPEESKPFVQTGIAPGARATPAVTALPIGPAAKADKLPIRPGVTIPTGAATPPAGDELRALMRGVPLRDQGNLHAPGFGVRPGTEARGLPITGQPVRGVQTFSPLPKRFDDAFGHEDVATVGVGALRDSHKFKYAPILRYGKIDLEADAAKAKTMTLGRWMWDYVREGGWNFKLSPPMIQGSKQGLYSRPLLADLGNFHFGYTAAARGYDLSFTLMGAGVFQKISDAIDRKFPVKDADSALAGIGVWNKFAKLAERNGIDPNANAETLTRMGFSWGDNADDPTVIMQGWLAYHAAHPQPSPPP